MTSIRWTLEPCPPPPIYWLTGTTAQSSLLTGLVHYWNLNETSGTRADSVGSATLADNNTVGYVTGVNGNAASFISVNDEYLTASDFVVGPTTLSMSIWFNPVDITSRQTLFSQWTANQTAFFIEKDNSGKIRAVIATSLSDSGSTYGTTTASGTFTAAQWNHLIVQYDGGGATNADRLSFYINGSAAAITFTGTIPASIQDSSAGVWVGRIQSVGRPFNGSLDEIAMWSRVLTPTERATLYNSGTGKFYPSF